MPFLRAQKNTSLQPLERLPIELCLFCWEVKNTKGGFYEKLFSTQFQSKDMEHSKGGEKMPIARKGTVILVLAAFVIALIPQHTIAGNKASKIGKLDHKSAHYRGDRTEKLHHKSAQYREDRTGKLDCAAGEIAKFDGSKWICAPDDNTDTLDGLSCISGEIAKFNGSEWVCMPDDDTLGVLDCDDGEVAKFNGYLDEWECAPVDGGGAAADCPDGFVALNDKVCIEQLDEGDDKGDRFTWFEANSTCIMSNARLCTIGEWVAACQENIIDSTGATDLEWTDALAFFIGGEAYMTTTTFGDDCTGLGAVRATNDMNLTFRCCRDR